MIFNVFKKGRYILKGRNIETGQFEDLEEYDHPVSKLEIRDVLEEYIENGYDYFRLEKVKPDGSREKLLWAKKVRNANPKEKAKSMIEELASQVKVITELKKALNSLGDSGMPTNPADLGAMIAYQAKVLQAVAQALAPFLKPYIGGGNGGGDKNELKEFLEVINMLKDSGLVVSRNQLGGTQPAPPQPNSNPISKEAEEEAQRILEEAHREAISSIAPCVEGKCEEGEEPSGKGEGGEE